MFAFNLRRVKFLTRKSFIGRFLRMPFRMIPEDAVVRILSGPLFGMRWIKGSHNLSVLIGSYERKQTAKFCELARNAGVLWDLGAHVGYYSMLFQKVNPSAKVYAFEPSPRNATLFRRHMELNNLQKAVLIEKAVSDTAGLLSFDSGSSTVAGKLSSHGDQNVEVVRIAELLTYGELEVPQLIKMDIEGEEFKVLHDIWPVVSHQRPKILLSTHGAAVHKSCVNFLRDAGYTITPLDAHGLMTCRELIAE